MTSLNSVSLVKGAIVAAVDESLSSQDVDLTNCDREPIHIPSAIQPHGILIAFDAEDLTLLQVSRNIAATIGQSPESVLGQPITQLFSPAHVEAIQQYLDPEVEHPAPLHLQFDRDKDERLFDGTIHQNDGGVILELEPIDTENQLSFVKFYQTIKASLERLQQTENLDQLCQVAVQEIQHLTQFDRVMVYRFHPDGSGSVIAESVADDAEPYLGLRYPATDIPKQARHLYTLNWLRVIPTIDYTPVPLIPDKNPRTDRPLDMSQSVLRSVSPLHLEYLGNMGVTASMSISLIRDRQLWGLIACHHDRPKYLNSALRNCCEFLGQIVSADLSDREQKASLEYRLKLKSLLSELTKSMAASNFLLDGLMQSPQQLMEIANAHGVASIEQGNITLRGTTPSQAEVQALLPLLEPQLKDNSIYYTHTLSQLAPEAVDFKDRACGLLALSISRSQPIYLLWFRPELVQSVNWAGNPHKPKSVDEDGSIRISPRQSFQKWSETVDLQSDPWQTAEVETVLELRSNIIGMLLQKAEELARVNIELARSNDELASFAYIASHDLKAPLRAIANLASWLQEDLGDRIPAESQHHLDLLQSSVYRMYGMIDALLEYSRVGRQTLPLEEVNLANLLQEIVDSLSPPDTVKISLPSQNLVLRTYQVLLKQVLSNLLSNAIKYIDCPDGEIEVKVADRGDRLQFEVKDNGPGIAPEYHQKIFQIFQTLQSADRVESTGIGLAIVKKVVESQGGELSVSSNLGEGCNFIFTWPKKSVRSD